MTTLNQYLDRSPRVPSGRRVIDYSTHTFDFESAVRAHLARKLPGVEVGDLTQVHTVVPPSMQVRAEGKINAISCRVSDETPELQAVYHRFVHYLADEVFGEDIVFEGRPQFRFHFPTRAADRFRRADGRLACQHSDVLLGDYFEQVNCWLPLARCRGTNSLQIAELPESLTLLAAFARQRDLDLAKFHASRDLFFEALRDDDRFHDRVSAACLPYDGRYGELMLFDPRVLHGTAENVEDATRISIDFRVLTASDYEKAVEARRQMGAGGMEFEGEALLKGGYYHALTAKELSVG